MTCCPSYEIQEYDPVSQGRPDQSFDWGQFDFLILDYQLDTDNGLEWLKEFGKHANFPPTIMLTGEGDEVLAVKALRQGAVDYITKSRLTPERLGEAIQEANMVRLERAEKLKRKMQSRLRVRDLKPGTVVDQFTINKELTRGATAVVFLAESEQYPTLVLKALDIRHEDTRYALARFKREYMLLKQLDSPHVVSIYDYGEYDFFAYIAMEYLAGGDLSARLAGGLSEHEALKYLSEIAGILGFTHQAGIVHRDLKPSNIMFREDDTLVLVDFGVARPIDVDSDLTRHGDMLGTPLYMSPEQVTSKPVDARSDIYSLGAIFVEMLTGQPPYKAPTSTAVMYKHAHEAVPVLQGQFERFNPLVQRMLAKLPADRFQNTGELLAELKIYQ